MRSRGDSNSQPLDPQSNALSIKLREQLTLPLLLVLRYSPMLIRHPYCSAYEGKSQSIEAIFPEERFSLTTQQIFPQTLALPPRDKVSIALGLF